MILALALSTGIATSTPNWSEIPGLDIAGGSQASLAPKLSGFLRTIYAQSSDLFFDLNGNGTQEPGEGDLGGFTIVNARLALSGEFDGWVYEVSTDFGGPTGAGSLIDAFAATPRAAGVRLTMGQFQTPFLRSGLVHETRTLLLARTRNGIFYSVRTLGAMVDWEHEGLHASFAHQNGVDGSADEALDTARFEWTALGPADRVYEGSFGLEDQAQLVLGGAWSQDGGLGDESTALAVDASFAMRHWSLQAELVDYEDDYTSTVLFPGEPRGGTTPFSVTAGWAFAPGKWEAALRYEDFDEQTLEREVWSAGLNRYVAGHDIKWQLNYLHADRPTGDEDTFALGLVLAF